MTNHLYSKPLVLETCCFNKCVTGTTKIYKVMICSEDDVLLVTHPDHKTGKTMFATTHSFKICNHYYEPYLQRIFFGHHAYLWNPSSRIPLVIRGMVANHVANDGVCSHMTYNIIMYG